MKISVTLDIDGAAYPFGASIVDVTDDNKERAGLLLTNGLGELLTILLFGEEREDGPGGWPKYGSRLVTRLISAEDHEKRKAALTAARGQR